MKKFFIGLSALALILTGCKAGKYADLGDGIFADIQTTKGDIVVKLYYDATPITVANFVSLAEGNSPYVEDQYQGKKFYDGLIFHRVMKDFMIQGGDPLGNGQGNPGYKFKSEFVDTLKHAKKGILSMANSGGTKTNGSQFFITHKATPWLDGYDNGVLKPCDQPRVSCHTVFGEIVKGIEVVDSIANVKVVPVNKPEVDVVMNKVEIIRNGKEAKKFDAIKVMEDYFAEEEKAIAARKKMLEEVAAEFKKDLENAEMLPSGLKFHVIEKGKGEQPKTGQTVLVKYAGYFEDGELFDTTEAPIAEKYGKLQQIMQGHRGNMAPTPMLYSPEAQLVPGFKEGLQTMKVGDKVRFFIPPHLGYGDRDYGPIPGGSTLIFDLEITGIQ